MARRAASIWRAVNRPRPMALSPNSPKLTLAPRVAIPVLRPLCSLRYFLLAGCSMFRSRLSHFPFRLLGWHGCGLLALAQLLTLVNPYLDPDHAVGGFRFGKTVVDISTEGMQRHAAFAIPLGPGDLDAVQAARTHDLDPLRAET